MPLEGFSSRGLRLAKASKGTFFLKFSIMHTAHMLLRTRVNPMMVNPLDVDPSDRGMVTVVRSSK